MSKKQITSGTCTPTLAADFDLRQLEVFCRVIELRSVSQAADAVFLTQSSVSERMANLARSVGVKLLNKVGREMLPTEAGMLLYQQALKHLALREETRQLIAESKGVASGSVTIGGSTIPGEYILPGVLARFSKCYPAVVVKLNIQDTYEIAQRVANGDLAFGIIGSRTQLKAISYEELWQDELVLVVPTKHPWAGKRAISPAQLTEQPILMRESGSGTRRLLEEKLALANYDANLNVIAELGSSVALKNAVVAGMGAGVISHRALKTEIAAKQLKALRITGVDLKRRFFLASDTRRTVSPVALALRDFILADADSSSS